MAVMRTSIHGRRLGLSSTGGILTGYDSTGGHSTAYNQQAQMWGLALVSTAPASGGTLDSAGQTVFGAGTTNGSTFYLPAPQAGLHKQFVFVAASATALGFEPDAAGIYIVSTATALASTGSTTLTLNVDDPISGVVNFLGVSTAQWVMTFGGPAILSSA